MSQAKGYPAKRLCSYLVITSSAYYLWLRHPESNNELRIELIAGEILKIHYQNPDHIAKNFLHRKFQADRLNEKWLTDVTEFKYYTGIETHKIYLSAILNMYDYRIVAFKISDHNDNLLVMDMFDEAVGKEPKAHPLFHSDRGFQYRGAAFYNRLKKQHMRQRMSRVAHCIDNGPWKVSGAP